MSKKAAVLKYVQNPDIIDSQIDDEVVMMNVEKGNYFGADPVGSVIWELFDSPHDLDQLVEILVEKYDVPVKQCKADIKPFVDDLKKANLLIKVD